MQTYGNGSAILSGVPATALTPEMSVMAAMGGVRLVPTVLAGIQPTILTVEAQNLARIEGAQRAADKRATMMEEIKGGSPLAEIAGEDSDALAVGEGETLVADLMDTGEIVEYAGDLAEVVALIEDATGVWVRIRLAEDSDLIDVHEDDWSEFGDDAEMMILAAYDRAEVARLRSTLISA